MQSAQQSVRSKWGQEKKHFSVAKLSWAENWDIWENRGLQNLSIEWLSKISEGVQNGEGSQFWDVTLLVNPGGTRWKTFLQLLAIQIRGLLQTTLGSQLKKKEE